jgi:hypothetical protein
VQVAGRIHARVTVPAGASTDDVERAAVTAVTSWLPTGYRVRVVPGRIVVIDPA